MPRSPALPTPECRQSDPDLELARLDPNCYAEKHDLAAESNLTLKQINDWFTNYRKRHWEDEFMARGGSDQ